MKKKAVITIKSNTLENDDDLVEVVSVGEGTTETKMEFKKNKENIVLYKTPYGIMNIKTYTKGLYIDVNECGGTVELAYTLILEEEQVVKTNLFVNIVAENN